MDDQRIARDGRPDYDELYREYLEQIREMERQRGRQMFPSELDRFTRAFYAPRYRADLERISPAAWDELHRELEEEEL